MCFDLAKEIDRSSALIWCFDLWCKWAIVLISCVDLLFRFGMLDGFCFDLVFDLLLRFRWFLHYRMPNTTNTINSAQKRPIDGVAYNNNGTLIIL